MSLSYYPPGTRKGNKFFVAIIKAGGRRSEVSTKALNKTDARRYAEQVERRMISEQTLRAGDPVTFGEAAARYADFEGLDLDHPEALVERQRVEAKRLVRLIGVLGQEPLGDLSHADLVSAANKLDGSRSNATNNREVVTPFAAVMHYAANNRWCPWLRVQALKQPKPKTRAVSQQVASELIDAAPAGPKRLLLWWFRMGTRISDSLRVRWDDIDLTRATVKLYPQDRRLCRAAVA